MSLLKTALLLAGQMRKQGIPFELLFTRKGAHGLSTAKPDVGVNIKDISANILGWPALAASWLNELS